MALNRDRIGHRYPSYRYEVSREKIREYAYATGVRDEIYRQDTGDWLAPPTFAACIAGGARNLSWAADPELGFHPALVHGSQRYTFARPVIVGDVLECTPMIADVADRDRMELLTVRIECVEASTAAPVVTAESVIIFFKQE